jgi:hypothetical protein
MPLRTKPQRRLRMGLLCCPARLSHSIMFRSTRRIGYSSEMPSAKTGMLALVGIRAARGMPLSTIRNQRLTQAGHPTPSSVLDPPLTVRQRRIFRSTPILRNLPDEHISQNAREQKNIENGLAPRFSHRAIAVANLSPMRRGVWYRSAQSFS